LIVDICVNYLSSVLHCPFAVWNMGLLICFVEKLKQSAPSRIVNVSSVAHKLFGQLDLANLNSEKSVATHSMYAHSKLALILLTRELSRRLQGSGLLFIFIFKPLLTLVICSIIRFRNQVPGCNYPGN